MFNDMLGSGVRVTSGGSLKLVQIVDEIFCNNNLLNDKRRGGNKWTEFFFFNSVYGSSFFPQQHLSCHA